MEACTHTAAEKMADNFRSTIASVCVIGDSKGIKQIIGDSKGIKQIIGDRKGIKQIIGDRKAIKQITGDRKGIKQKNYLIYDSSKTHFCTRPASWLPEKTPGCHKRYRYPLRAPRNRSDADFLLLVQTHHTIL